MTFHDPYVHIPPPTDDDYTADDGHYGTVVALRGELVEKREDTGPEAALAALTDGYRPTDVGNAQRLIDAADGRLRYVHLWQRWIVYTGGRWVLDAGDALVTEVAKRVARGLFTAALNTSGGAREDLWKHARKCETSSSITNMIRLARAIPGVIITHEELDARPWLLNVENGTVDLRTGELLPHDPADLITKQAPVTYDPAATCPLWDSCLMTWQPDPEVRGFLQRAVGSGATGHPVEVLIVNYGNGRNGKSRFYGAVAGVLGEYVVEPHRSLFVQQKHEPHPTVIASLYGARSLIASETEDGERLDETQVKNLTGGDRLRARRMREDEWSFRPSHTAFMHTNHPPRVRGSDEGIWRRLKIVPWDVTIPAAAVDEHLSTRLAREAAGILNWIVAGARWWAQEGLTAPPAVTTATDSYRASEDHVGRFLADCTEADRRLSTPAGEIREAYEKWCAAAGETPWSAQAFGRALTRRGYESGLAGRAKNRVWKGLNLLSESPAQSTPRMVADGLPVSPVNNGVTRGEQEKPSATIRGEQVYPSTPTVTDTPSTDPEPPEQDPLDLPF